MGKAMIRLFVLRLMAEIYVQYKQKYPQTGDDWMIEVPAKILRMAHEIIEENDKQQIGKEK
jgi:hypothetical protein